MAVTLTLQQFAERIGEVLADGTVDTARLQPILDAATAIVEDEAPNAPETVQNAAVVRFGGFLPQSAPSAIVEEEIGAKRVQYQFNLASGFYASGAKALLSRWKHRRAGVAG